MAQILQVIFWVSLVAVVSLGIYAVFLLIRVRKLKKIQNTAIDERLTKILCSIDYINTLVTAAQLDLAEASIRLNALLQPIGIKIEDYPNLNTIYKVVGEHATGENIKELEKNTSKKQKFDRLKIQSEYGEKATKEIKKLTEYLKTKYDSRYFDQNNIKF